MTKKLKKEITLGVLGIVFFAALIKFDVVVSFASRLIDLCFPLIFGLILALILNAPMRGFENILDKCFIKKKLSIKAKYTISLLLSIIVIVLVLVLVMTMAIPKVCNSFESIIEIVEPRIPNLLILLEKYGFDTTSITNKLENFNPEEIIKNISRGALSIISTTVDATKTAFSFITDTILSLIISIYLLLDKNNISRHFKKLFYSILPQNSADYIYKIAYLIRDTFSKFLSGQCLEAIILGLLIFIVFSIVGLPYASLIAAMSSVLSFVPYIGSFMACLVGTFLTLISEPKKALVCVIVYLLCQFIEQHFIYPHVVGNSVGLSPFYTVVAVLLGGKIFGVLGMIFFIPLFSVFFVLLKELSQKSLNKHVKKTECVPSQDALKKD